MTPQSRSVQTFSHQKTIALTKLVQKKDADSFLAKFEAERRKHGGDSVRGWLKEILLTLTFDYTCWVCEVLGVSADQELAEKLSIEILLTHFDQAGLQAGIDYSIDALGDLYLKSSAERVIEGLVSPDQVDLIHRHIVPDQDPVTCRPLIELMDVKTFQKKFLDGSLGDYDAIITF